MTRLRYSLTGLIVMYPGDDLDGTVDAMLETGYDGEFCASPSFEPDFVADLMKAGFLVMSAKLNDASENQENLKNYVLLPKLHLVRSALFFENLHIKKSIRRFLPRYELRFDPDFEGILGKCLARHGEDWLTPPLVRAIREIRDQGGDEGPRPVSFGLYREGRLAAGEIGIVCGKVYTSYTGYFDEDNAGTVQLVLLTRWLEEQGFDFFDLGMPLPYKYDLGALDISPEEFVKRFRNAQVP